MADVTIQPAAPQPGPGGTTDKAAQIFNFDIAAGAPQNILGDIQSQGATVGWNTVTGIDYNAQALQPMWQALYAYLSQQYPDSPQLQSWFSLLQSNPSLALGQQGADLLKANPALATQVWQAWGQIKTSDQWAQLVQQYPDISTGLNSFFGFFDPNFGKGGTSPSGDLTDIQKSAKAEIESTLGQYGLASLGDFAWKEYLNGIPIEQIMLDIRGTSEYKARFPAMEALAAKGHAMSEAAYISYEKQITSIMRAAGIPEGMFDQPDDFKAFLENELSPNEVGQRVQDWLNFASTAPTINQIELNRLYGVQNAPGAIAGFFLDAEKALPLIEKEANSALIGAQSLQGGYADLSRQQAEYIAGLGIKPQETLKGFQQLVQERQLFQPLPGQAGPTLDTNQQLQGIFGGQQSILTQIENTARQRVAQNEGDYQYLAEQSAGEKRTGVGGAAQT